MMKSVKRFLAAMLGLVLALGLTMPAAAQDSSAAPIITRQPKSHIIAVAGWEFRLKAEAVLPEGVEGTLSYVCEYKDLRRWYGSCDEQEDGSILCWDGISDAYTIRQANGGFALRLRKPVLSQVIHITVYNDETGDYVTSDPVKVTVLPGLLSFIYRLLRYR